jgi:hypothetical protein
MKNIKINKILTVILAFAVLFSVKGFADIDENIAFKNDKNQSFQQRKEELIEFILSTVFENITENETEMNSPVTDFIRYKSSVIVKGEKHSNYLGEKNTVKDLCNTLDEIINIGGDYLTLSVIGIHKDKGKFLKKYDSHKDYLNEHLKEYDAQRIINYLKFFRSLIPDIIENTKRVFPLVEKVYNHRIESFNSKKALPKFSFSKTDYLKTKHYSIEDLSYYQRNIFRFVVVLRSLSHVFNGGFYRKVLDILSYEKCEGQDNFRKKIKEKDSSLLLPIGLFKFSLQDEVPLLEKSIQDVIVEIQKYNQKKPKKGKISSIQKIQKLLEQQCQKLPEVLNKYKSNFEKVG